MATPDLLELQRAADEAWRRWREDEQRQKADAEVLERLQPALAELRERFAFPHSSSYHGQHETPSVLRDPKVKFAAQCAVWALIEAGGSWTPPEQR